MMGFGANVLIYSITGIVALGAMLIVVSPFLIRRRTGRRTAAVQERPPIERIEEKKIATPPEGKADTRASDGDGRPFWKRKRDSLMKLRSLRPKREEAVAVGAPNETPRQAPVAPPVSPVSAETPASPVPPASVETLALPPVTAPAAPEALPTPVAAPMPVAPPPPLGEDQPQASAEPAAGGPLEVDEQALQKWEASVDKLLDKFDEPGETESTQDEESDDFKDMFSQDDKPESGGTDAMLDLFSADAQEESRSTKLAANLEGTPGYGVQGTFACESCGSRGTVAMPLRCTRCGTEGWWGWWPKEQPRGGPKEQPQERPRQAQKR